jgi:hypothetical protein
MSQQIALDNIHLRPCARWAHTEYSLEYHREFLARRGGHDQLSYDLFWSTNDGPVGWGKRGRVTDMGHAVYAADGSDQRASHECPFKDEEEVWAFDAVAEYGLPDFDELVQYYEGCVQKARTNRPNQLTTGGYYKTIVSGALEAFGWDMLLLAASDSGKMEKVFDSFFRLTLHHMRAWAKTSVPVIIQHDDFVWTAGPFVHPDFYRQVIIPRYAELWKPLHAAGKKVLFCSDGDFREFAGDVVAAGANGLIFEPVNDFGWMAERFGQTTCLVGSFVDCRDLTFGNWDKVQADIDRTFECLRNCRGAIVVTGNHLAPNIPTAMLDRYFDYLLPRLTR